MQVGGCWEPWRQAAARLGPGYLGPTWCMVRAGGPRSRGGGPLPQCRQAPTGPACSQDQKSCWPAPPTPTPHLWPRFSLAGMVAQELERASSSFHLLTSPFPNPEVCTSHFSYLSYSLPFPSLLPWPDRPELTSCCCLSQAAVVSFFICQMGAIMPIL